MGGLIFTSQEKSEKSWPRRILVGLMASVLVASLVIGSVIYLRHARAEQVLTSFQSALDEGSYNEVIELYRMVREKALVDDPLDRNAERFREALGVMEKTTGEMLLDIEGKLTAGQVLAEEEIRLVENLAELSAARMITRLRTIARDYLFGRVGRAVVDRAFTQIGSLENISQGVAGLPDEFDQMEALRLDAALSVSHLEQHQYWTAWEICEKLLAAEEAGPFVREQLLLYQQQCRDEMYQPLLEEALRRVEGGRYLSAHQELTALQAVFPDATAIRNALETCVRYLPEKLEMYNGPVEFITIKPLIHDSHQAFSGPYASAADETMLTVSEFSAMISALYDRGYILIDGDALYNEQREPQTLQLPPGKKPLVLVVEGVNYYVTRQKSGNAWNLVLDDAGEVAAEYYDETGRRVVERGAEVIGLLDQFVAEHPDFALDGAKGTLSLTGYECIFGYVTDRDQLDDRNQALQQHGLPVLTISDAELETNRETVRRIADRLIATGWRFASSTYGFINARDQSMERIQEDTEKWLTQVGSLTGPVTMLHYPNGAFISGSDERAEYLKDQGFILFTGLGPTAYLYLGDRYLYVDKVPVNGYTLRNSQAFGLERFFDASRIMDRAARGR